MADQERLVVLLEARVNDFEKRMARASASATKSFKQIESGAVSMRDRVGAAASAAGGLLGKLGLGGIAAGGITGIVAGFRELSASVAEVGDRARIAGVSVKAFQELKFAADQVRIPVDALQDGLKELSLRTDEFVASSGKSGSAAESFNRLGYSVGELKQKIKEPSDLLVELVGRVQQLDRAAQTRIFDELFGGQGGEEFVKFLTDGEAGLRKNIKAANDLGIVMDEKLIKKAAEVDRQFNLIATTVSVNLKSAIVAAADAMGEFTNQYAKWRGAVDAGNAGAAMGALVNTKLPIGPRQPPSNTTTPTTGRLPSAADILRGKLIEQRLNQAFEDQGSSYKAAEGSKARAAAVDHERQAVVDLISDLQEELRLVGASDEQKRASAALRMAGAKATDAERAQIVSLTAAIAQEEEAREKASQQAALYQDLTRAGLDDLFSALADGENVWKSLGDVAVNSLKRIGDSLIDDVLDSIFKVNGATSGGGGFLSGLLGLFGGNKGFDLGAGSTAYTGSIPGFAKGTDFAPGGLAMVGEKGPELVNLPRGSQVIPNMRLPALTKGGGSNVTVHFAPVIDARGADGAGLARVEQQLARLKADIPGTVVSTVKDAQKRRML